MSGDKKQNLGKRILAGLKAFFSRNLAIKIISLLFAMLLWGYVMMETNPVRIKTISNVTVSFDGEDDLLNKNLTVRGDRSELLPNVTVDVSVNLTRYSSLDASSINARASLRSISKPGTYRLLISATTTNGTVVNVSPREIVIEVDTLAARTVPIEVEYSGTLPESYWRGTPTLSTQSLIVRGAAEDVARVEKAICTLNLNDRTTSFNESVLLTLVDGEGEEVDSNLFIETLPSVVVKMDILPMKTVDVDTAGSVLGVDALPANYEVVDIIATPAQVRIAGDAEVLETIDSIPLEQIDVSGSSTSVLETLLLQVPDDVILLDDEEVNLFVDIREKTESQLFTDLSIEIRNLDSDLDAVSSQELGSITLTGRISLMRQLSRSDVTLYVDAAGLAAGQHVLPVQVELPEGDLSDELTYVLVPETVTLTISS